MEEDEDIVYQGEVFKLSEPKKRLIGSKTGAWKVKYLIFRIKKEKPTLEYHKRKPKLNKKHDRTLTDSIELWPSFRVEKLKNARGRTFVCEITTPDTHIFLSVNEEKEIDLLVFLLQVQIRLKSNLRDDLITVVPDDSECLRKIGAAGCKCILHASPWGLTLALEKTRSLLAQWPLKSIRYYEVPSPGHFNIEAGRVAPMGEGLFQFKTQNGYEDFMYDLVDSYIVNTLDRVKPTQKGTPEEIEDYIREHECLHSLTTISVCSKQEPEIRNILNTNWNLQLSVEGQGDQGSVTESRERDQAAPVRPLQSSSLVINLERPRESSTDVSRNGSHANDESRVTDRPPPLPSINGGRPRRSRRREHSIPRKVDVGSVSSEGQAFHSGSLDRGIVPYGSANNRRPSGLSVGAGSTGGDHQHQHTEFYSLASPNMKVRKSKSPIVTKTVNKVGRAEYLLSQQQSGVKSPTTSLPDSKVIESSKSHSQVLHSESPGSESIYIRPDHRISDQGYVDHFFGRSKNVSGSELSITSGTSSRYTGRGYVNLQDDTLPEDVQCQGSVPETSTATYYTRTTSKDSLCNDHAFSPPVVRHIRQRSADELSRVSVDSLDGKSAGSRPSSHGRPHVDSSISNRPESGTSQRILEDEHETGNDLVGRQFSGLDSVDNTVNEWLMSASCEDLSDHMRTVIYDDNNNGENGSKPDSTNVHSMQEGESNLTLSSSGSSASNEKPPLPFTGLKKFHDNTEGCRDRSRSFGYMNLPNSVASSPKVQSSAPSAHLIRKMVNARAKQETLRKSLSNPNFLNLGSKEHLFNLKASVSSHPSKLSSEAKHKSKSFSSLFPAIKKALSRESLGHSRSTTPDRRSSRNSTPERRSSFSLRRRGSDSESNVKRQNSFHSIGEMTIKGVRMTERSRSFRKVRGAKSVEALSRATDDTDLSRLSSATTASSPPTDGLRDVSRCSASSRVSDIRHTDMPKSPEISRPSSQQSRMPVPLSAVNPNYVTTAHIELSPSITPLPTNQPPPIPARVRLDNNSNISQAVRVSRGESSHHNTSGYLNTLTDLAQPHSSKVLYTSSYTEPSGHAQVTVSDINQVIPLTNTSAEAKESGYRNFARKSSTDEVKPPEASSAYENAPDVDITVKKIEVPLQPRRPLVSHLVAQMEKNCGHAEPQKVFDKSPKLFHRSVPPKDMESESVNPEGSKMADESLSDAAHQVKATVVSASQSGENREMMSGRVRSINEDDRGRQKSRVKRDPHVAAATISPRTMAAPPAGKVNSIPKPFQPVPFKRQEPNGVWPVKAPTIVKHLDS